MADLRRTAGSLPPHVTGTVVTVGTFDGIHRGHIAVLDRLVAAAEAAQLPSVVVSFDPHPLEIVRPAEAPSLLTTRDEKLEIFAQTGVNYVSMIPFDAELSRYSAEQFVEFVLLRRVRMKELLIGYDHGMGRGRAGDADTLREIGRRRGFEVSVVPPVLLAGGNSVSSTVIRRAVSAGDMSAASEALGRRYGVTGVVVRGAGRGRGLGFPTLNLEIQSARKLLPLDGIYAVEVFSPRGTFGGMLSIGGRPTFGESERTIEAYLFDVDADFYGMVVRVDFVARLREIEKFEGIPELRQRMEQDEIQARRALTPPR